MNKIELEIVSLQSSVTHMHSYAVVLGEVNGDRKIPIVIGGFEAQAIAVALENLQPKRPLTHDLMVILFNTFDIVIEEVYIYRLEEAIFYSQLVCIKDGQQVFIDCRTSDAIAIAIRSGCPIYAAQEVIDASGMNMDTPKEYNEDDDFDNDENNQMDIDDEDDDEEISINYGESDDTKYFPENFDDSELSKMSEQKLKEWLEEVLEREDYALAIKIRDELKKRDAK